MRRLNILIFGLLLLPILLSGENLPQNIGVLNKSFYISGRSIGYSTHSFSLDRNTDLFIDTTPRPEDPYYTPIGLNDVILLNESSGITVVPTAASEDGVFQCYLDLGPGNYTIRNVHSTERISLTGCIVQGDGHGQGYDFSTPVELGLYRGSFSYTNCRAPSDFGISHFGEVGYDMFYHFSLGVPMAVNINTFGSPISDNPSLQNSYEPCRIILFRYSNSNGLNPLFDSSGAAAPNFPSSATSFPEALLAKEDELSVSCKLDQGSYYVICQAPYQINSPGSHGLSGQLRTNIHGYCLNGVNPACPIIVNIENGTSFNYEDVRNTIVYNHQPIAYRLETTTTENVLVKTSNSAICEINGLSITPTDSLVLAIHPPGLNLSVRGLDRIMFLSLTKIEENEPEPEPDYTETLYLDSGVRVYRRAYSTGDNVRMLTSTPLRLLIRKDCFSEYEYSLFGNDGTTLGPSWVDGIKKIYSLSAGEYHLFFPSVSDTAKISLYILDSIDATSGADESLTTSLNYIVTRTALAASLDTVTSSNSVANIDYYDLLGRPLQTIVYKGTPYGEDLVTRYNSFEGGRKKETWESVPIRTNSGSYVGRTFLENAAGIMGDNKRFTFHGYSDDLLDREIFRMGPGLPWHEANKGSKREYGVNTVDGDHSCLLITVSNLSGTLRRPIVNGPCTPGRYHVIESVDEDERKTIIFYDNFGNLVLERKVIDTGVFSDTYYVYDDKGLLSVIVPPEASRIATSSGAITPIVYSDYCYSYSYDNRGRCIGQKRPGCNGVFKAVYGKTDKPVFTQTPEQSASNLWECDIPDKLGRSVIRAIVRESSLMVPNRNDDIYVERASEGEAMGYTISVPLDIVKTLEIKWYDDYSFLSLFPPERIATFADSNIYNEMSFRNNAVGRTTKSFLTGRLVYAMDSDISKLSARWYDYWGNCIMEKEENVLGGISEVFRRFDYRNNEIFCFQKHTGATVDSHELAVAKAYDKNDRLLNEIYMVGTDTLSIVTLAYDDYGREIAKIVETEGIEDVIWKEYNARDWPTRIRDGITENRYAYERSINQNVPQWAGNISNWIQNNGGETKTVNFCYDRMSRLTRAQSPDMIAYYTYDRNGNILSYSQSGELYSNTNYTYKGNQLQRVGNEAEANIYDSNGRLVFNAVDSISLQYNNLDRIEKVRRNGVNIRNYSYLSDGRKLSALNEAGNGFLYAGSLIYRKSGLSIVPESAIWSEGRMIAKQDAWGVWSWSPQLYSYDHLGSIIAVRDGATGAVIQENEYSPYGLRLESGTSSTSDINRYFFNGKEDQSITGLPLLDYGERMYSPSIGRWLTPDPKAESLPSTSPYAFCNDNPVNYRDPDGKFPETLWDVANLVLDVRSLIQNIREGNVKDALVDGGGIIIDAAATLTPFVPGGAGTAIKASREGVKATKVASEAGKAVDAGKASVYGPTKYRVKLWKKTTQAIIDKAKRFPNGDFIEPNERFPIPKNGPYDIGHKRGKSWKERKKMHEEAGHTRKQVIEMENDPDLYQIEDPHLNRSHKYE